MARAQTREPDLKSLFLNFIPSTSTAARLTTIAVDDQWYPHERTTVRDGPRRMLIGRP